MAGERGPMCTGGGKPVCTGPDRPGYASSMIRLASGAIGLKFDDCLTPQCGLSSGFSSYFTESIDEGNTWSAPVQITRPGTPANATWMIQTHTGRIVLANEYAFVTPSTARHSTMNLCTVFYSDDEGKSWGESSESLFLFGGAGSRIHSTEVPCVVEMANGRLLMFMRTELQRLGQSYSDDDGEHWSEVELNGLVASHSEVWLARLPSTDDLLCVWNQVSGEEMARGYYRARLSSAISHNGGEKWERFRTIMQSPGMQAVGRIDDHAPPGFFRSGSASPPVGQIHEDGFRSVRAPRVVFVGDIAYMVYHDRGFDQQGEPTHHTWKLCAMPGSFF